MNVKPYPGTNAAIEEVANRMRQRLEKSEPDMSSVYLLRRLIDETGGEIVVAEDPSDQEVDGGSLVIRGKRDFTIFLSPFTTPLRDNFTIAHELGHYVLHFFFADEPPRTPVWFTRYGSGLIEWQANRFAAAILMPDSKFRSAFERFKGNLSMLSGLFNVSLPAVEIRAKSLELLRE